MCGVDGEREVCFLECVQDFPHFSPLNFFIETKPFGASVLYATPEVPV